MCGITVVIKKSKCDINVAGVSDALSKRGPDESNIVNYENLTIIHTRLFIQNQNYLGKQPYEYLTNIIVYNGEIYNFRELANKYDIDATLDTDLIIKLYTKYENIFFTDIIKEFDGIFCFAIINKKTKKIYIVRDMFGVKPLFYFENDNIFAFSSTVKTFHYLSDYTMDKQSIYEFWNFRQCFDNKTILKNINIFKSGYYSIFNFEGHLIYENKYTDLSDCNKEVYNIEILREKINKSIESNLLCDMGIKIGCFLSGGIDSSYIYNYCRKIRPDIYSYSIGFEKCNEFDYVNRIIDKKSTHNNITITIDEYLLCMVDLISNKGYPLQVPNEVMISMISRQANKDGLRILLAGEGADEIFHGYGKIFSLYLRNKEDFCEKFWNLYKYVKDDSLLKIQYENGTDYFSKYDDENIHKQDLVSKIFLDFHIQGLTNRLDAASMAFSIEARVPFLNQSLVRYVYNNVPRCEKIKRNYDEKITYNNYEDMSEIDDIPKYCLKKIAEEILPNEIIYRKKVGFPVPIEDINDPKIMKLILKILNVGYINKYNIINKERIIDEMFNGANSMKYIIFNLINFEIFIQLFIEKINVNDVKKFIHDNHYIVGYTCGVFDMFHIGHLNILQKAKSMCDYLIVAITTDEKVIYKQKHAIINQRDRFEIVNACKYVDKTVYQEDHDKFKAWEKYKYDILFVGDDWKGHPNWINWEKQLDDVGSRIMYIPYTQGISSSLLRKNLVQY